MLKRSPILRWMGLLISLVCLALTLLLGLLLGAAEIPPLEVVRSLFAFDDSTNHLIITTVRMPRVLLGGVTGAALAVAGALMQGLTRNPLADPGILGISAGAAFAVVITTFLFGGASMQLYTWVAFLGAAITALAVYRLGSMGRGGTTPLKLVLAGAVLSYLMAALTTGLLLVSQRTLEEIRFWLAGSLAGRDMELLLQGFPYIALGLVVALGMGRQMTALALGEDVAQGLGLQTQWVKAIAAAVVVVLAGGAVAMAGPIGFIGFFVPHVVRFWVGADYRWLLPYAAVWGALLLSLADLGARVLLRPQELPVGIVTALLGAPFFVYLARSHIQR